jgi:ribonuclease J
MRFDLENSQCLDDAALIYSMWPGYLEDAYQQEFLEWLKSKNIPLIHCHTSGHAPIKDLQRLAKAISPKRMVPIHTFEPGRYQELFEKVHLEDDGAWWEV